MSKKDHESASSAAPDDRGAEAPDGSYRFTSDNGTFYAEQHVTYEEWVNPEDGKTYAINVRPRYTH
ncbi:hypothetical protein [Pseudomonas sp. FYR_11]|uniref:hypothetical protein n=1 Tax=Pseudomonas TaxID=286 RepID=UPI00370C6CFF